eukprot:6860938-Prymnesium_polylepis.1
MHKAIQPQRTSALRVRHTDERTKLERATEKGRRRTLCFGARDGAAVAELRDQRPQRANA